jgi:hypothetical protein
MRVRVYLMIKIIELRKIIKASLKTVHPNVLVDGESKSRVHYENAPDKGIYPYLVYDLPNSNDDGSMEQFILDVDGWDNPAKGDTTALETLMDNVDKQLHRKTVVINGTLSMTFYRENRIPLKDDDPRIKRRKYVYQVRTYNKEV